LANSLSADGTASVLLLEAGSRYAAQFPRLRFPLIVIYSDYNATNIEVPAHAFLLPNTQFVSIVSNFRVEHLAERVSRIGLWKNVSDGPPSDIFDHRNFTTVAQSGYNGRTVAYTRGHVLGGSTALSTLEFLEMRCQL
jgi:choline dehydrogenase-like flavoprotein